MITTQAQPLWTSSRVAARSTGGGAAMPARLRGASGRGLHGLGLLLGLGGPVARVVDSAAGEAGLPADLGGGMDRVLSSSPRKPPKLNSLSTIFWKPRAAFCRSGS